MVQGGNTMLDKTDPLLEFTAHDRCDRCGAQAYTLAKRDDMPSELLFCLHHRKEFYDALLDDDWEIVDDYEAISRLANNNQVYV